MHADVKYEIIVVQVELVADVYSAEFGALLVLDVNCWYWHCFLLHVLVIVLWSVLLEERIVVIRLFLQILRNGGREYHSWRWDLPLDLDLIQLCYFILHCHFWIVYLLVLDLVTRINLLVLDISWFNPVITLLKLLQFLIQDLLAIGSLANACRLIIFDGCDV